MQSKEVEQETEKVHFRQKTQAETKARAGTLYSIPVNVCCSVARTPLQFESILNVIE